MNATSNRNVQLVQACWKIVPPWLQVMAEACDHSSQAKVAEQLGYQAAVVNQVLRNKYKGSHANVMAAVSGAFEGKTVSCPILGDLPVQICLQHQRAPFALTNPQRTKLFRACRDGCPHSHHCKKTEEH